MKKNLYYRHVLRRRNAVKEYIVDFLLGCASYPRLMLEVFIRKNFGERYLSKSSVFTVAFFLLIFPIITSIFEDGPLGLIFVSPREGFWKYYTTLYLFLLAFLYFSYQRLKEIKRNPSVFDFKSYSLSSGSIHPFFYKIRFWGKTPDIRRIETLYEPVVFFIIGNLLALFQQPVGILIEISSVLYGLSYRAAYKFGDDFIMDFIDQVILNEEMEDAFVHDKSPDQTRGVRFYMKRPSSEEMKRKVVTELFTEENKDSFIAG